MIRFTAFLLTLCGLLFASMRGFSQANSTPTPNPDCPNLVRRALDLTKRNCEVLAPNQVCYGHSVIQALSRFKSFRFDKPGDIEDVISLQSLSLSAMSLTEQIWGVMLMQVQAGLRLDSDKNITMVFFGDTTLDTYADVFEVTVSQRVNTRELPSLDAPIKAVLAENTSVYANARTADSAWLRLQLYRDTIDSGWVLSSLVESNEDLSLLPVVDPNIEDVKASFGPMQAFYFESGKSDAPCEEAPNSGLLIQTPEGVASVTLWIDEVVIELNATAFLQAQANGTLDVNVVEGFARVTSLGETQTAVAGTSVRVELDENLNAASEPSSPEPFNLDSLQALPIELLQRPVTVPEPFDPTAGLPANGRWQIEIDAQSSECGALTIPFVSSGSAFELSTGSDGETLTLTDGSVSFTFNRTERGRYSVSYISAESNETILYEQTLEVVSATRMVGQTRVSLPTCSFTIPFAMDFIG